jgi:hypothetical protein
LGRGRRKKSRGARVHRSWGEETSAIQQKIKIIVLIDDLYFDLISILERFTTTPGGSFSHLQFICPDLVPNCFFDIIHFRPTVGPPESTLDKIALV